MRRKHAIWFQLAEDLNRTGQGILGDFTWGTSITAQHLFGILLLIRSLSNFQGALLMAERGMVVEARTLARCCFENAFCIGALLKDGDAFISEMMNSERQGTRSKARWILKEPARLDFSGPNAAERLRARVADMDKEWGNLSQHNWEQLSRRAGLGDAYLYYKVLSGDAAHPSVSALDRYVMRGTGRSLKGINRGPDLDGVEGALNCACQAMLAICVATSEMFGNATRNRETASHAAVYAQLNGTA